MNPTSLTTRQRAHLRGLAQPLRPQLHIGHAGLSDAIVVSLEELLKRRELVKGRVLTNSEESPEEVAERLAESVKGLLVGVVGNTFVIYRANPKLKEPIELPVSEAARARPRTSTPPRAPSAPRPQRPGGSK